MSVQFVPVKLLGLLLIGSLIASTLAAKEPERPRVVFVQGFDVLSNIHNPKEFQNKVNKALEGCEIEYQPNPPDGRRAGKREMLALMAKADIFYTNSHASLSSSGLQVQGGEILQPDDVKEALSAPNLPRLVIINGCATTSKKSTTQADELLFGAFGIDPQTKGRAYLGWKVSVVGVQGDNYFGEFLVHWTTRKRDGSFPTLADSRRYMEGRGGGTARSENLDIIGDETLRYDFALGIVDKVRIVGEWRVDGVRFPNEGKLVTNHSFDTTRVSLLRDGSLKIVLSAVDSNTGRASVIGSFSREKWYLAEENGKTVIHYTLTDPGNEESKWCSLRIDTASGPTITLTDVNANQDVTLKPAE